MTANQSAMAVALALFFSGGASQAADIQLTGTVRDFHADGVNFEGSIPGVVTGAVESVLSGASPTLTATGAGIISNTGSGAFDNWFTRSTDATPVTITLSETSAGSGIYTYANNAFFPVDGKLYGNEGNSNNFHFTYVINGTFDYNPGAGQTFQFSGDDDVWVYFDKKLGIDLGGVHGAAGASVNLDTLFGPGKAAGTYSLDFFFAERHTSASNLQITTSLQVSSVPEPGSVGLALAGLGVIAGVAGHRLKPSRA